MKTITLLIAFVSAAAALVVPTADGDSGNQIEARDNGQQLTNPDREDPYIDPLTGASIEKSRILAGIGPQEAQDRHFDWDESCVDEQQRKKIMTTFVVFQELVKSASDRLRDLKSKLPQPITKKINDENRQFIAKTDFAYTQMFRAWDSNIDQVINSFDKVTRNVKNFPSRAATDEAALRFICNANNQVLHANGSPLCG
jgi:hypothetical protein